MLLLFFSSVLNYWFFILLWVIYVGRHDLFLIYYLCYGIVLRLPPLKWLRRLEENAKLTNKSLSIFVLDSIKEWTFLLAILY